MDDREDFLKQWGLGVAVPVALAVWALVWGFSGHVVVRGRHGIGETVFEGWGAWAIAGLPFGLGLWLHAEHFWTRHPSLAPYAQVAAGAALWLGVGAGLATVGAILVQFRP